MGTGLRRARASSAVAATVAAATVGLTGATPSVARAAAPPRLLAFDSCPSLVSYARRNARRVDGPGAPTRAFGVEPQVIGVPPPVPPAGREDAAGAPAPVQGGTGGPVPGFSGTNVQEPGVDEPDIVKSDGKRIFAVVEGALHAVDVTGPAPKLVGTLPLAGHSHQILLRGDRILVMANRSDAGEAARLSEIGVADPAAMAVRRTLDVPGRFVDGRMTGGTARVVVASPPQVRTETALERATLRAWVPRTVLRSRLSGRTFRRSVVGCDDVRRPREFSGLDLLTVLTVDLDHGLFSIDRDAIMAGADTVYGSEGSLYIASRRYSAAVEAGRVPSGTVTTEIHRFDTSKPEATEYRSSGRVEGFVLNQYALSEHAGKLRVATTTEPDFLLDRANRAGEVESSVTVLDETARTLAPVGRVGGLGRGERIYAVRFIGERGYVVTFRETDPLYTLDLSNPAAPRVVGELKILGYSAYLHPVAEDRLLGVGQDATTEGRTRGAQLSLFDVSDPARPTRLAKASLGEGSSTDAEFDPHAFLYWAPTSLAVVPLQSPDQQDESFAGAVGFRIGATALAEAGRVQHATSEGPAPIARSLVVGDRLFTLSYAGLGANRLDTLAAESFTAFPQAPRPQPPDRPGPIVERDTGSGPGTR